MHFKKNYWEVLGDFFSVTNGVSNYITPKTFEGLCIDLLEFSGTEAEELANVVQATNAKPTKGKYKEEFLASLTQEKVESTPFKVLNDANFPFYKGPNDNYRDTYRGLIWKELWRDLDEIHKVFESVEDLTSDIEKVNGKKSFLFHDEYELESAYPSCIEPIIGLSRFDDSED